jgi:hypothetical protein
LVGELGGSLHDRESSANRAEADLISGAGTAFSGDGRKTVREFAWFATYLYQMPDLKTYQQKKR